MTGNPDGVHRSIPQRGCCRYPDALPYAAHREGWLVAERGVCCGAGLKDETASSAQPDITPARIKTAVVRRNPIASPSSAQTMPQVKLLAIVLEVLQLKAVPIEESPLDPDVIANPKRPKTIHI